MSMLDLKLCSAGIRERKLKGRHHRRFHMHDVFDAERFSPKELTGFHRCCHQAKTNLCEVDRLTRFHAIFDKFRLEGRHSI